MSTGNSGRSRFKDRMYKNKILNILRKKFGKDINIEDAKEYLEVKKIDKDKEKENNIIYYNFKKAVGDFPVEKKVDKHKSKGTTSLNNISNSREKSKIVKPLILPVPFVFSNTKAIDKYESLKRNGKDLEYIPSSIKETQEKRDNNKEEKIINKQDEILKKIKDKLIKQLNELEVIESDMYLLETNSKDMYKKEELEEQRKKIEILLNRVNNIIKQYNIFKNNLYLDNNIIWLDDKNLVDDIIEYRNMLSDISDNEILEKNIALLEEYQIIYDKIVKIENKNNLLEKENEKRLEELKEKDHDYNEYENKTKEIEKTKLTIERFLLKQNKAMDNLEKRIGNIDAREMTEYKIQGLNKLMFFNFKYIAGLLLLPFKGIFPCLAMNAVATREMIKNMNETINLEQRKYFIYSATDYDRELNYKLYSIEDVGGMLDSNIDDISRLEKDIYERFRYYDYEKTQKILKKLRVMKEVLNDNRYKLEKIKSRVNTNIKKNKKVLTRVRNLNQLEKNNNKIDMN